MTSADDHDLPGVPRNGMNPAEPPAGLRPPVDPWMADAPTSPFSPLPPYAGAPPLGDTRPDVFASSPAQPVTEPRRRRGAAGWIIAGLAVLAVGIVSVLVIDRFGADPDGDDDPAAARPIPAASTPAAARQPSPDAAATSRTATTQPGGTGTNAASGGTAAAAPPGSSPAPAGPVVVYEVTASGSGNIGSVQFIDQDGEMIRLSGIPLPWRTTFTPVGDHLPVLLAQREGGGDRGPVTCTVTVDGKVTDSTTARGRYAAPMC